MPRLTARAAVVACVAAVCALGLGYGLRAPDPVRGGESAAAPVTGGDEPVQATAGLSAAAPLPELGRTQRRSKRREPAALPEPAATPEVTPSPTATATPAATPDATPAPTTAPLTPPPPTPTPEPFDSSG